MKHRISILPVFITLAAYSQSPTAQVVQKIGHADWEYIFSKLPELKKIEVELVTFEAQLQNQLKQKRQELETKYKVFQSLPESTPEAIRKDKESELVYLQQNIQQFQQDAQQAMQKKQSELMAPVFTRVGKAIEEVAIENGYAYVMKPKISGGNDFLLYASEKYDISELVLAKLATQSKN